MGVTTDMVFRLLALDEASGVFKTVAGSADETGAAVDESNSKVGQASPLLLATAAAAAMVAAKCINMASVFQAGMETLVTGAGESQSNIKMLDSGVLSLSVSTATSTQQLTDGLYHIESAGVHGTAALNDLKIAAEGAKIGNADLDTVAQTMVGTMNSFGPAIKSPTSMMNMLISTVSSGDMKMQDLAGSVGTAASTFASAHIPVQQYLGAIATMTSQNMTAQESTQILGNLVSSLANPTAEATKEMAAMGLNSTQVSMQLGKVGLTGTLTELTSAITSHMGPAGTVLQSAFASSTSAAADAKTMISSMPAPLQKLATAYQAGTVTSSQWKADLKGLSPVNANLMTEFAGVADKSHSFNTLLAAGGPAAQTYNAALSDMTGGVTGLKASLMLTGQNASTFENNVKNIGAAGQKTTGDVTGWSTVTGTLSFKLDQARAVIETLGIRIGTVLMPVAAKLVGVFMDIVHWSQDVSTWLTKHKTAAEALAIGIAAVLLPSVVSLTISLGAMAIAGIAAAAPFVIAIAVCAALAAGFMELIKHWNDVENMFVKGFDFVKEHWMEFVAVLLPGIGFLIDGGALLVKHWSDVTAFFSTALTDVSGFFMDDLVNPVTRFFTVDIPGAFKAGVGLFQTVFVDPIMTVVDDVETGFEDAFTAIPKFVTTAFSGLVGIVKAPINGVIDVVNMAIGALDNIHVTIPSWVPGVGGDGFGVSIPKIPTLALGGMVLPQSGGTTVTVAEAGEPEIVSPLPAMTQAMTIALANVTPRGGGAAAGPGSGPNDPLYVEVGLKLNGREVDRILLRYQKQGGKLESVAAVVKAGV